MRFQFATGLARVLLARSALLLGLVLAIPFARAADRAVWTWERESYAMVGSPAAAEEALRFLHGKRVTTIYLYADAYRGRNLIAQRPELYRHFIQRAHGEGFKVYALLGSAYLRTEEYVLPQRRAAALAMMQRVLSYNAGSNPDARFDGVNLDIEPHILAQWKTRKMELLRQFLDLGQAFMTLKRASGQTLSIGPAIPFWLDGIEMEWNGVTRPVSEHVIDLYDYVALMDYRHRVDGSDGIIAHAANEMAYAAKKRKRVVIGLEVTPNELSKVTFNHLTEIDLERAVAQTERAYRDSPAFAGFALHHYRGYRRWLAGQPAGLGAGK
ncbi:MAG TPA: hypothetical protein VIT66_13280 [Lysobacter sp.]